MADRVRLKLPQASLRMTLVALNGMKEDVDHMAREALSAAGSTLFKETKTAITNTDHSQSDLDKLDHPYAKRHGSIRIHTKKPWIVHIGSSAGAGAMADKLIGRYKPFRKKPAYEVSFAGRLPDEVRWVLFGTVKMLPRDPLWEVASDPVVRKKMMKTVVKMMGAKMRSKGGVRFSHGTGTGIHTGRN